jgi:hypothetical protein
MVRQPDGNGDMEAARYVLTSHRLMSINPGAMVTVNWDVALETIVTLREEIIGSAPPAGVALVVSYSTDPQEKERFRPQGGDERLTHVVVEFAGAVSLDDRRFVAEIVAATNGTASLQFLSLDAAQLYAGGSPSLVGGAMDGGAMGRLEMQLRHRDAQSRRRQERLEGSTGCWRCCDSTKASIPPHSDSSPLRQKESHVPFE